MARLRGRRPHAGRRRVVTASEHVELPAGGGAVAAVQLRKLAGQALFLTALGDDEHARRAAAEVREAYGVELHAAIRARPQRRAVTHLDAGAERTITVLGERLVPHGEDPLPWERLAEADGVYLTGGDGAAARAARAARVLVATARAADALLAGEVAVDVLVASGRDEKERASLDALPAPRLATILTDGARGGRWEGADGRSGTWPAAGCPARRSTRTAAATRSPPASRTASRPAWGCRPRSSSPPAAAPTASPAAGPTPLSSRRTVLSDRREHAPQRRHRRLAVLLRDHSRLARPVHASAEPSPRTSSPARMRGSSRCGPLSSARATTCWIGSSAALSGRSPRARDFRRAAPRAP